MSQFPDRTIHLAENATYFMGARLRKRTWAQGIQRPDGRAVPCSDIVSSTMRGVLPEEPKRVQGKNRITEPCMFAGLAEPQFGHVLTNALGRLWAVEHLPADCKLVFASRPLKWNVNFPFLEPVLRFLNVQSERVIIRENTTFDRIYVPTEIYGERFNGLGSPAFFDWVWKRLPRKDVQPGKKVYVTRGSLTPTSGRYACENVLEENLSKNGYEIFAPEKFPLEEQIATLTQAEKLIFAEGTPLHLYYLAAQKHQSAAVIMRRASMPGMILNQMKHCPSGQPVHSINVITDILWRKTLSDNEGLAIIDFAKLRDELINREFLGPDAIWREPSAQELQASRDDGLPEGERLLTKPEWQKFLNDFMRQAKW